MSNRRGDRSGRFGWLRWSLAGATFLILGACASPSDPVYVVGDSTMAQVEGVTERGATEPGCGFTDHAECTIPLDVAIPDDAEVIVAAVSIWDRGATDEQIAAGYRAYHSQLSELAPVVWVELPPLFGVGPNDPSYPESAALNASVASALGCTLLPWTLRFAPSVDGVHYTDDGAEEVADRFADLTVENVC